MNKNELRKNEIIETMLESKWMNVYVNKLNKKFSKYSTKDCNPSKDSLISNLDQCQIFRHKMSYIFLK